MVLSLAAANIATTLPVFDPAKPSEFLDAMIAHARAEGRSDAADNVLLAKHYLMDADFRRALSDDVFARQVAR